VRDDRSAASDCEARWRESSKPETSIVSVALGKIEIIVFYLKRQLNWEEIEIGT
jgi:hypothetical protein